MLPKMGRVLKRFERDVVLSTVTQTVVNFRPVDQETTTSIRAVLQPAQKEKLNPEIVDWSLVYKTMHTRGTVKIGDYVTEGSFKWKVVELGDYEKYGYHEAILEQVK